MILPVTPGATLSCSKLVPLSFHAGANLKRTIKNGGTKAAVFGLRYSRRFQAAFFFTRRMAAAPARPAPNSESVSGSGTSETWRVNRLSVM